MIQNNGVNSRGENSSTAVDPFESLISEMKMTFWGLKTNKTAEIVNSIFAQVEDEQRPTQSQAQRPISSQKTMKVTDEKQISGQQMLRQNSDILARDQERLRKRRSKAARKSKMGCFNPSTLIIQCDIGGLQFGNQNPHGYIPQNADRAFASLAKRKLFIMHSSESREVPQYSDWNESIFICSKTISVPSINEFKISFEGRGLDKQQAENECNLVIVKELYDFDVIREAALELYCPERKEMMDPTKRLDAKLSAWLNSSTDTFLNKIDEIAANSEHFN